MALGWLGEKAGMVAPALAMALTHMDYNVRRAASESIGRLGSVAMLIAGPLGQLLRHEDETVRLHAATALLRMGAYAKPAAEDLSRALVQNPQNWHEESAWQLRVTSARALGLLGGAGAASLATALEDEVDDVRCAAAEALGHLGEEHVLMYREQLEVLLQDIDSEVRAAAKKTLALLPREPSGYHRGRAAEAVAAAAENEGQDRESEQDALQHT
eukprot:TRINITY_DN31348_c0_g1_i1.p1 TRINITY_DN31348_c0_g1~~TRINITY_DN31348_c0_g1_i1.p1  ORF type:complete len:215 (-),score=46.94 TRINITY_DN31348_c0_g1_i1:312-956(-)